MNSFQRCKSKLVASANKLILKIKYKYYRSYFKGKKGLEVGGPSDIFCRLIPIYEIAGSLDGCNFSVDTVWEGRITEGYNYSFHKKQKKGYQFICDATNLQQIRSEEYDFVLSSNCIEHIANPFVALSEWLRVLKTGGYLLLVVPHKDGAFDHRRPVTSIEHLTSDFEKGILEDDLSHLDEILRLHDLSMDIPAGDADSFKKRSLKNYENRCLHHHVFDTELAIKVVDYFKLQIFDVSIVRSQNIAILARKTNGAEKIDNTNFISRSLSR